MFRLGLIIYLVIATVAGPSLCCCSTTRLFASGGSPATHDAPPEPAPTSCCPHCTPPHQEKAPVEQDYPHRPQCPCKQHNSQQVLSTSEIDGSSALSFRLAASDWVVLPLFTAPPLTTLQAAVTAVGDRLLLPFLSTQDLLFSHHLLRC